MEQEKQIYSLCADVLGWMIENNNFSMPADKLSEMCGNLLDEVISELKERCGSFMVHSNTIWVIKKSEAESAFVYYVEQSE